LKFEVVPASLTPNAADFPMKPSANIDARTVASFGEEWSKFDQSELDSGEHAGVFDQYFAVFPWDDLPASAEGFDMGCGSGRWAKLVAPRVGKLNCIDASKDALAVARQNLSGQENVEFHLASVDATTLEPGTQDFGYSLGVLHHIPDTRAAVASCVRLLKPGAPLLVYLYYSLDNRPAWFRLLWKASDLVRHVIFKLPSALKFMVTDALALVVYWPLARLSWLTEKLGADATSIPLYAYRDKSFYMMRTDSRDRFGTPLEQRFSRQEIADMMRAAGLKDIVFSESIPYWCAVGRKAH
jgi:SAM-dependent methyltransferase